MYVRAVRVYVLLDVIARGGEKETGSHVANHLANHPIRM